jgi:DNA (cytosine-5)-methyltransferase 1
MRIGSLFAGIGGLELGLERAGLGRVVWQVEQSPFRSAVLARHWPEADRSVTDVRQASAATMPAVDVICGGFPCQDISVAGDGAGLAGERSGLWGHFRRLVDELRPAIVIAENVAHGRNRYLCAVRSDLHELGYHTTTLLASAAEVGAPHLRDRCFVVAHTDGLEIWERAEREPARRARGVRAEGQAIARHVGPAKGRRAQSDVGRVHHGLSPRMDRRWPAMMGERPHDDEPLLATAVARSHHDERLTALGNAVVPQCAEVVGRWILANVTPA